MTGIIVSNPPTVELPPGSTTGGSSSLPGVTYTAAVPTLSQTWTGLQTFTPNSIQFAGSTSGNTFLNATAIASGTVYLPAVATSDTLLTNNNTAVVTNKSIDGLQNTITNVPTGSLDPDLQAIAALTGTGGLSRIAADTWALRTVAGTANEITITNGNGVSGNPTVSLPSALTFTGKTITGGTYTGVVSFNGNIWTAGTGTLTLGAGKTATINNTLTFTGTDASSVAFGAGGTVVYTSNNLSVFAATTSAQLRGVLSDETGTGLAYFQGGDLGTPSAGILSAATGLPISTGVSGLGTGIAAFLATPSSANLRTALTDEVGTGAAYFVGGALGTPASGTATNLTGLPLSGLTAQAAYTIVANATGSSAVPTAMDVTALTSKASPVSTDIVLIQDSAASNAFKKTTVGALSSAGSVSSIAGNTGAFTLGNGIDNSTNQIQLTAARRTLPTIQRLTSGTGATYTTPANCLWIRIKGSGGGGGGAGGGGAGVTGGGTGNNTTFSGGTLVGNGGPGATAGGTSVIGGTASGGNVNNITGNAGDTFGGIGAALSVGGMGASGAFGGGSGAGGGTVTAGTAGQANSGAGGGGGGASIATAGGSGGSAGGYFEHIITSPAATYTYTIGSGGTAGGAGTSGTVGAAGGSGVIIVEEHYGS